MNTKVTHCVYRIIHHKSGKSYVGSTSDFQRRKWEHESDLRLGRHRNAALQAAYNDDPNVSIVVEQSAVDREDAYSNEQRILDAEINAGVLFNVNPDARNIYGAGVPWTDERKALVSYANTGNFHSPETKKKISESLLGRNHSEETKAKMSEAKLKKAKPISIEGTIYPSIMAATQALGVDYNYISNRIRSKSEQYKEWFFVDTA